MSATQDLTALVLVGCDITTGNWHVAPTFWLPTEGLHDKARVDKVPYDLWQRQGFLETTPGSVVSYEYVAQYLRNVFDQHRVGKIGFGRWNIQLASSKGSKICHQPCATSKGGGRSFDVVHLHAKADGANYELVITQDPNGVEGQRLNFAPTVLNAFHEQSSGFRPLKVATETTGRIM